MARPIKYDWTSIEKAYIQGADIEDICKKYKIAKKTLQNKIYEFKWEIKGNINADVNEFKAVLGKVTETAINNPETTDIYIQKIVTVLEDNKLIQNNRKLMSAVQGIIGQEIRLNKINASNVKSITGAILDIEKVANPQANKQEINIQNTNAVQTNNNIDIENMDAKQITNAYLDLIK